MIKKSITDLQFDIRKIAAYASQKKDCIRADIGEPNYSPSKKFSEILENIIPSEAFEYAPTFGVPKLISALEEFEQHKMVSFKNPQFCVTSGGQAALFSVISSVFELGDIALVNQAYYPPYKSIATICGGKLQEVDFNNLFDLEETIDSKIKAIIVNSPNNPTGEIYSEKMLKNIADFAKKHDLLIISDDVYDTLIFDKTKKCENIANFAPERTIICNSVSKSLCLTGARIGWILGEEGLVAEIAKVHRNINSCPNTTFQNAVAEFLPQSDVFLNEFSKELEVRAQKISKVFNDLEWEFISPTGGMYIWVKIPDSYCHLSSEEFVYFLIDSCGVSGVPGNMFGENSATFVRFCFGALCQKEIEIFGERLSRL